MAFATLYCLDEGRNILRTELRRGQPDELRRVATDHLQDFPIVELWEGGACSIQLKRRGTELQLRPLRADTVNRRRLTGVSPTSVG